MAVAGCITSNPSKPDKSGEGMGHRGDLRRATCSLPT